MRRTVLPLLVASAVGVVTALSGAHASAVPGPTIGGPTVARYFAAVTLTGTTPEANQAAVVHIRRVGAEGWSVLPGLRSDGSRRLRTVFRLSADAQYYLSAGGASSAGHYVRIVRARCTSSKPVTKLPLGRGTAEKEWSFLAFVAQRGTTWAGVTERDTTMAVVTWRAHHAPRILAHYSYANTSWEPASPGSLQVAGISPHGYVSWSAQKPKTDLEADRTTGYIWRNGSVHRLSSGPSWQSVRLVGVTSTGAIVGYVRTGTVRRPRYAVVRWSESGLHFTILQASTPNWPHPVVDGAGDVAYYSNGLPVVRLASGRVRALGALPTGPNGGGNVSAQSGGPGTLISGTSDGQLVTWNTRAGSDGGPVRPVQRSPALSGSASRYAVATGPHGAVLDGFLASPKYPQHLLTASGAYVRVPSQLNVDVTVGGSPGEVISDSGVLSYTALDGLVRLLRCR